MNQDERDAGVPTSRVFERRRLGGRGSTIHHDESHRAPLRVIWRMADGGVRLYAPASFSAVGSYYLRFEQTSDDELRRLLQEFAPGASVSQ